MHDNKSIIKSFKGDVELADRELVQYEMAWKYGGHVGNLPLAVLLDLAVRHQKKDKPPTFSETLKAKGRPKGSKNKPKPELVVTNG